MIPIKRTVLGLAIILLPASLFGQDTSGVTGAGAGSFAAGAVYSAVNLSALEFGIGVYIPGDGSATGHLDARLLGTTILGLPQNIDVDGEVDAGFNNLDGSRTFSGTATVNLGNGTPPLTNVPFTLTATPTSLFFVLGATNLPSVTLTGGSISVH